MNAGENPFGSLRRIAPVVAQVGSAAEMAAVLVRIVIGFDADQLCSAAALMFGTIRYSALRPAAYVL